jgi:hypothetical protein
MPHITLRFKYTSHFETSNKMRAKQCGPHWFTWGHSKFGECLWVSKLETVSVSHSDSMTPYSSLCNLCNVQFKTLQPALCYVICVRGTLLSGCINFPKISVPPPTVGTSSVTWRKFHTQDSQILGATAHNLVATATWCQGFAFTWVIPVC